MGSQPRQCCSVSGSLEMLILRLLSQRDLRAYGMVQLIQQSTGHVLLAEEGSLYPALQHLDVRGWIEGTWVATQHHRRARTYRITPAGRKQLAALTSHHREGQAAHLPGGDLKGVNSRLLLGCALTGIAFGQQPTHPLPFGGIPVDVCMEPNQELRISANRTRSLVSAIFSQIGVNLTWQGGSSECGQSPRTTVKVRWARRAPAKLPPGTLATSRPFESSESLITIYEVPLQQFLNRYANARDVVLSYVLAHELAHLMQGLDHHSDSGIMKANWSHGEYYRMLSRNLTFTAEDVELIHIGLEAKRSKLSTRARAQQDWKIWANEP